LSEEVKRHEKQWAEYNKQQDAYFNSQKQLQQVQDDRIKYGSGNYYNDGQ
jgi:hypothetical protein